MTRYKGARGTVYETGDHIKDGGEGKIFGISGDSGHVLKIYTRPTPEQERKLKAMASSPLASSKDITWPVDVVYDSNRRFAGYVMPRIYGGDPINVIYEHGPRAKYPEFPWRNRITIAMNLCAVLEEVHAAGQVVGDFNPLNMFVNIRSGHVKLVDTDSYHITDGDGVTHRCSVGMVNYLAPEVIRKLSNGLNLQTAPLPTFTEHTDNFALAVHIFQLLMNGAHPFQCCVRPGTDLDLDPPSIKEAILKGKAPHFRTVSRNLTIPMYAPGAELLTENLRTLFDRAFLKGALSPSRRPKPKEWLNALMDLKNSVIPCYNDTVHSYPKGLTKCPLCEADRRFTAATGITVRKPKKVTTRPLHRIQSRLMGFNRIADDPNYVRKGADMNAVVSEIVNAMAPIERRYLEHLTLKMLGLRNSENSKRGVNAALSSFRHVKQDDYDTFLRDTDDYNTYGGYLVSPPNAKRRDIDHVCLLEMRNAILQFMDNQSTPVDPNTAITAGMRAMGYPRSGARISKRFADAFITLFHEGKIVKTGPNLYRIRR